MASGSPSNSTPDKPHPSLTCPRCGPVNDSYAHKIGFYVLRISPEYGLICVVWDLEVEMDIAGLFFARRYNDDGTLRDKQA